MTTVKKIGIYILGLFVLALGVSVSVKSNLGISPVNSLPYVLSRIIDVEMGYFTMAVFIAFIVIQLIILKKDFKVTSTLQIVCSIAFGYFVNLSNYLMSFFAVPDQFILRLILALTSAALCGLGIFLYVEAKVIPLPAEGLTKVLSEKSGKPFSKVKVMFDLSMVIMSLSLSLAVLRRIDGIGIGTILSALLIGKFIGVSSGLLKKKVRSFIGEREPLLDRPSVPVVSKSPVK